MPRHRKAFHRTPLYRKSPARFSAWQYLKDQSSFWIAVFTVFAFVTGNMVGQNGWYAFWKAAWGAEAQIAYDGAVSPIESVPDYRKWSAYGGSPEVNTYRQVPSNLLVPLPAYDAAALKDGDDDDLAALVYSVGYMGSYATGHEGDGSHPGTDIRVPEGTPIRAVMNGIVTSVREDSGGFGKLIVIKHPNVPDPLDSSRTTTLYSVYAHLSTQEVEEEQVVNKGDRIALSGKTGFATGPHLHFQIDRGDAPWHPYWPFTGSEAREAGLSTTKAIDTAFHQDRGYTYTVNPLAYVQTHTSATTTVARGSSSSTSLIASVQSSSRATPESLRAARLQTRLARRVFSDRLIGARAGTPATVPASTTTPIPSYSSSSSVAFALPTFVPAPVAVSSSSSSVASVASSSSVAQTGTTKVAGVSFSHGGSFNGRQWEQLHIILLDRDGNPIRGAAELEDPLHLMADYGQIEFEKNDLTASDFTDGEAILRILPRGQRTIVIHASAFPDDLSPPLKAQQ